MRILVPGSEGTLGKPLVRELESKGYEVYRIDLQHNIGKRYYRADVANYRQLERFFKNRDILGQIDYVYHLAAEFGRINGEEYYDTLWQTNVVGTRNILELQRIYGFRLIFASSSEIYGERFEEELTEDLPTRTPIVQHNDYATSKWVNEVQIMNFEKKYGNEVVRLRFFNAYGEGERYHDYRSVVCLFCYRALHDLPYTVYEGYSRVFMHISDFIPTLAKVCEKFVPGEVYNIGGTEYKSVKELSDIILNYLGKTDELVTYLPEDKHNTVNKLPNIDKARLQFGHEPKVTLEVGIPKTIEWMRSGFQQTRSSKRIVNYGNRFGFGYWLWYPTAGIF